MKTNTGERLTGRTPQDWVHWLRDHSYFPEANTRTFMRQAARRAKVQTGKKVRSTNANVFIADLVKIGLLSRNHG